jgi:hypothetical protein
VSTPVEVNNTQIADRRATNYPYKVVAAEIRVVSPGRADCRHRAET